MKHGTTRGFILAIAVILIFSSSFYFESYKAGGPMILKPTGEIIHGLLFFLSGMIVIFDSFFKYQNGFTKRKHRIIDVPFMLGLLFVFTSIIAFSSGFRDLLPMLN